MNSAHQEQDPWDLEALRVTPEDIKKWQRFAKKKGNRTSNDYLKAIHRLLKAALLFFFFLLGVAIALLWDIRQAIQAMGS